MTGHYILLAAASTAADAVEAAERDLTELSQIKPGMIKQMLEGLGPSLMSLGWKLFIALILFLAGRKLIRFVQRMMSASFEPTGDHHLRQPRETGRGGWGEDAAPHERKPLRSDRLGAGTLEDPGE